MTTTHLWSAPDHIGVSQFVSSLHNELRCLFLTTNMNTSRVTRYIVGIHSHRLQALHATMSQAVQPAWQQQSQGCPMHVLCALPGCDCHKFTICLCSVRCPGPLLANCMSDGLRKHAPVHARALQLSYQLMHCSNNGGGHAGLEH